MRTAHIIATGSMALITLALLVSCHKEPVLPGYGNEAYINFYNASEVLKQGIADLPDPQGGVTKFYFSDQNMVFVNDSAARPPYYSGRNNFTTLEFSRGFDDMKQLPNSTTGSTIVVDHVSRSEQNVFWMPVAGGSYRFMFTSAYKNYVAESIVELQPKTYTTQYLTEDPATDSSYRVVNAPVYIYADAGKVRIQTVHLSPDRGAVDVYRMDKDGKRSGNAIVSSLQFGEHNNYVDIDTTGASGTFGNIVLGFYQAGADKKLYTSAVPAKAGASFIAVIQGFVQAANRRIIINAHGYNTATWPVSPDFRVNVRRVS